MRYDTEDEILFLRGIGSWNLKKGQTCPLPRKAKLLWNYIQLANLRSNWGDIEKEVAVSYAQGLLHTIQRTMTTREAAKLAR